MELRAGANLGKPSDSAAPSSLSTWRDPVIMAQLRELERQFEATLTPAQHELWRQISDFRADQAEAEQERFVTALGEHMPGLAKAIEIVAFGHGDITSGKCCEVRGGLVSCWRSHVVGDALQSLPFMAIHPDTFNTRIKELW